MRVDERLRDASKAACRGASDARKELIENTWDAYSTACDLSRGGDPERSKYWERKAKRIEFELSEMVIRRMW